MAINKIQRSRLTFELSANVDHIGVPLIYLNLVFSEIVRPIELKFHIETPEEAETKLCTKCPGHMTKMTAILIYGKTRLKIMKAHDLGTWYVAFEMWGLLSLFK